MQEAFKQQPKRGMDAARQSCCVRHCRDLGHRKKFNDKLKTDPVWSVYHKAYKAHTAGRRKEGFKKRTDARIKETFDMPRYLKKKMTQAEFQRWADYAIELRTKALDSKIEYDEYVLEMKK